MPIIAPPHNESRHVAKWITEHEVRIKRVEDGLRRAQLGNSSLEGTGLNYYDEDGNVRGTVGRQPDGTYTATSTNNPNPPPVPNAPIVVAALGGLVVTDTGTSDGTSWPADFSHLNVYTATAGLPEVRTLQGTITPSPGSMPIAPLEYDQWLVTLTSVNYSKKESEHSLPSTGTPNQAVGADLIDGIIQEVHLNSNIVGEATLKANAVTVTKIADGSISTPKIVAGAVDVNALAANSVNAGKIVAGSVTTEKIAALAITANELAVNAVTATKIAAGSVTALKLEANMVIASRIIAGTLTGNRVEMHPIYGIQAYTDDGGTRSFFLNAEDGSALIIGEILTAVTGSRIVLNYNGVNPDEARFYQGGNYGRIFADPAPGGTAAIIMEGSGTTRGRIGAYPTEAFVSYFDGSATRAAASCLTDAHNIWGGSVNIEARDQWGGGEVVFTYRNTSNVLQTPRTLVYRGGGSGEPVLYAPNSNTQIVWIGTGMIVQDGAGGGTKSFFNSSSREQKKGERPILFGTKTALEVVDAVPSKAWNYNNEWVEGEPEPPRRKIKSRTDDERDDAGRLIKSGEEILIDAPPEPKMPPHFGPIAEDLMVVAPDLVTHDLGIPGGLGLSDRDLIGVLWEAVRQLSAEVKTK